MLHWIPFIIYAGLIFYLSSLSYIGVGDQILVQDSENLVLHVIEFFPLGFFAAQGVSKTARFLSLKLKFSAILIGSFYGLSDEIHQFFVPGRTSSFYDVGADASGVILGVLLFSMIFKKLSEVGYLEKESDDTNFKKIKNDNRT
jgi:glycopeptide antibiotics resistance protein